MPAAYCCSFCSCGAQHTGEQSDLYGWTQGVPLDVPRPFCLRSCTSAVGTTAFGAMARIFAEPAWIGGLTRRRAGATCVIMWSTQFRCLAFGLALGAQADPLRPRCHALGPSHCP